MVEVVLQKQIIRFTCDICARSQDSTNRHRPDGWRTVHVQLNGKHLFPAYADRRTADGDWKNELACSNGCIAALVRLFEPSLAAAWNEAANTPQRDACESCRRLQDGKVGWRRIRIQLSSEHGFEGFSADTSDPKRFLGEIPSVCSFACGIRLLREVAEKITQSEDRTAEDRAFAQPRTVG
jgi:hypothetical protein